MSIDIERLKQLCAKGLDRVQIAQRLGTNREAVRKACKKHGISVVVVAGYESRAGSSVKTACAATESSGSDDVTFR
jgi:hypothetical protein